MQWTVGSEHFILSIQISKIRYNVICQTIYKERKVLSISFSKSLLLLKIGNCRMNSIGNSNTPNTKPTQLPKISWELIHVKERRKLTLRMFSLLDKRSVSLETCIANEWHSSTNFFFCIVFKERWLERQ